MQLVKPYQEESDEETCQRVTADKLLWEASQDCDITYTVIPKQSGVETTPEKPTFNFKYFDRTFWTQLLLLPSNFSFAHKGTSYPMSILMFYGYSLAKTEPVSCGAPRMPDCAGRACL